MFTKNTHVFQSATSTVVKVWASKQLRLRVKECILSMNVCVCIPELLNCIPKTANTYALMTSFEKNKTDTHLAGQPACAYGVCLSLFLHAKFTLTIVLYRDWREFSARCGLLVLPQNIFLLLVPVKTNEQNIWFFFFFTFHHHWSKKKNSCGSEQFVLISFTRSRLPGKSSPFKAMIKTSVLRWCLCDFTLRKRNWLLSCVFLSCAGCMRRFLCLLATEKCSDDTVCVHMRVCVWTR